LPAEGVRASSARYCAAAEDTVKAGDRGADWLRNDLGRSQMQRSSRAESPGPPRNPLIHL